MANILTVYFSMKGETIWTNMTIKNLEKGNTAVVAEFIQKAVGGDLFEIETTSVYSEDHFKMIYEAQEEMKSGKDVEPKHYLDSLTFSVARQLPMDFQREAVPQVCGLRNGVS